jgi:hypothetical protein
MNQKELRRKRSRAKVLKARADAQAFNQTVWSTVAYRHGRKSFTDHGTYDDRGLTLHQRLEDVSHDE